MLIMDRTRIRDAKMEQLKRGYSVYAESSELSRLLKRSIERNNISVYIDETNNGSWFIPIPEQKSS